MKSTPVSAAASTGEDRWTEWFVRDGDVFGVPEERGGDGSVRVARGPAGRGIVVARRDEPVQMLEAPPGVVTQPLIAPSGAHVVWFHDQDGDDIGEWMYRRIDGGPSIRLPVPAGYFAGGAANTACLAIGIGRGLRVDVFVISDPCLPATHVFQGGAETRVRAASPDRDVIVSSRADGGHGVRVTSAIRLNPAGWPERSITFSDLISDVEPLTVLPSDTGHQVLLRHSRLTGQGLVLWNLETGDETELPSTGAGVVTDAWAHPDHGRVVLRRRVGTTAELHQLDLNKLTEHRLSPVGGTAGRTVHVTDEHAEFVWSSTMCLPAPMISSRGVPTPTVAAEVRTEATPTGVPLLIAIPHGTTQPAPTVFLIHGGPGLSASDQFDARAATYLEMGLAVVQVNYRGSAGHGDAWLNALYDEGPLAQVDDLAAARNWCVANGIAEPGLCILHGTSWGAYLTLLAVGRYPQDWAGAIAVSPIADLAGCYSTSTPSQQQLLNDIFGGGPHGDILSRYFQASPLSYLADVSAPVQLIAHTHDARCPLEQIQTYAAVAHEHGKHVDLATFPGGHRSHPAPLRIEQMRRCRTFIKQLIEGRDAL